MSKKFQDVEISGVIGLHEEEAQLLLAVAEAVLEELTGNNASQVAGTILLDGQPENGEAQLVLRANLPGGAFHRNFLGFCGVLLMRSRRSQLMSCCRYLSSQGIVVGIRTWRIWPAAMMCRLVSIRMVS